MDIKTKWKKLYPECIPVAFLPKENFEERYVCFYNLPGAKRYPICKRDYKVILKKKFCYL